MTLEDTIKEIMTELDDKEKRQDKVLQISREAVREAAKAIKCLHTNEKKECLEHVKIMEGKLKEMKGVEKDFEHIAFIAYQEYVELKCLLALLEEKKLPSPKDLGVEWQAYLSGLADCVGELRRALQLSLRNEDKENADYLFTQMNYLYDNLMTLKYSGSLVGALKKKQDMIRSQVEQARSEMLRRS